MNDMTILHLAISLNNKEFVDFILMSSKDVDKNKFSESHGTPIHIACKTGNIQIVQKLVLSGADSSLKDKNGKLAIELTQNQKIIYLLEKYNKLR